MRWVSLQFWQEEQFIWKLQERINDELNLNTLQVFVGETEVKSLQIAEPLLLFSFMTLWPCQTKSAQILIRTELNTSAWRLILCHWNSVKLFSSVLEWYQNQISAVWFLRPLLMIIMHKITYNAADLNLSVIDTWMPLGCGFLENDTNVIPYAHCCIFVLRCRDYCDSKEEFLERKMGNEQSPDGEPLKFDFRISSISRCTFNVHLETTMCFIVQLKCNLSNKREHMINWHKINLVEGSLSVW